MIKSGGASAVHNGNVAGWKLALALVTTGQKIYCVLGGTAQAGCWHTYPNSKYLY